MRRCGVHKRILSAATNPDAGIQLGADFHTKLATAILECEGGTEMAETFLARFKGREEVNALIKEAKAAHAQLLDQQAQEIENQNMLKSAEYQEAMMLKQAFDAAPPEEQKRIVKFAHAHEQAQRIGGINVHPALKMAYAQGAEDAQMMMDSSAPPEGADPAAAGGEPTLPGAEASPEAGGPAASVEEIA